jgi:hypothetical protein
MKKNKSSRAKTQRRKEEIFYIREKSEEKLSYRTIAIPVRSGEGPGSLDEKTRSVEVVGASENPAQVWDWERMDIVDEVLLMSGVQLPDNRQVPLFDTHMRGNTATVVGSYRDMSVGANGGSPVLLGRAYFTNQPEGEGPFQKVREGHITDFSVGYRVIESEWVSEGQKSTIAGRTFEGPLKVSTKWVPRELSVCPIGADDVAKARGSEFEISNLKKGKEKEEQTMKMSKELRAKLVERGMPENATDEEAFAFLEKITLEDRGNVGTGLKPAPTGQTLIDTTEVERMAREEERGRVAEIGAMARKHGVDDTIHDRWIKDGVSVEEARKAVLKLIEEKAASQKLPPSIEFVADDGEKFRAAATDSLILRGGKTKIEKPAPGALELRGYTLREMARLCLQRAGVKIPWDPMEMIGRAMMTGDFPILLGATANKSLFAGWESAPETWAVWCATGSVSDFKTQTSARASETDDLDLIPDHGEYKYGKRTEAQEQYAIATYGKLFALTRHTIINDDLNALTDIPYKHGEAWARKVGDLAYAILTANAAMGDGKALFIAAHGNIGTAGTISEVTIAEALKLMKVQKGLLDKQRLNIRGEYIIGPAAIEGSAEIFFNSGDFSKTSESSTRKNPYAGSRFTRVYDARLDDNSATIWYLAGPKGKTVVVFFLNGVQTPFLETKTGWSIDGVEYKVRGDAGAKAMDWKALLSNAGA